MPFSKELEGKIRQVQDMESNKTPNYFVRSLVVVLCGLLVGMLIYNFFLTHPLGEINAGLITLIGILVVIILSESFDSFSVGKIISISRENKKKEIAINRLTGENDELRKQIINVVTSVNQNQSSTNIVGVPEDIIKKIIVQRASEEEIQERETEASTAENQAREVRYCPDSGKIKDLALNKFILGRNFENFSLIKEAKLVTQFHGIDSISNAQPIFDGYINMGEEEVFFKVHTSFIPSMIWRERVYVMLNKIYLYRSIKKSNAYLYLIMATIPREAMDGWSGLYTKRIDKYFEPAITNALLRIVHIELTTEEAKLCMREVR